MNSLFAPLVLLVTLFCFASFVEARYQPLIGDSFFIDLASGDSISRTNPGTAAKIYDVNLTSTSNTTIAALKAAGINVVCYVPIGVASSTDSDYASIPSAALGNHVSNSSNLRYLDVSNIAIYPVIQARIALAASKGCDGVDLAYTDTYGNATSGTNSGFDLTLDDSVLFFQNMANYAHIKNLAAGLRNGAALVQFVEQRFADFSVVENCFYENTLGGPGCGVYSDFIADYHPVFPIEYHLAPSKWCRRSNTLRYFGGYYPVSLNGTYTWCSTVATIAATPSQSLALSTSTSVAATPSLGASQISTAATNPISLSAGASPSKSGKASKTGTKSSRPSNSNSGAASPSKSSKSSKTGTKSSRPSNSNSVAPSTSKSSKASKSNKISATGSKSNQASKSGAASPSSSLAASAGSSPAASVNPTVVNTVAASPSLAASVTNACITCANGCGPTASPLYNKCSVDLQGTPSAPTSTSFCCATNLSPFSYVWRVDAANCSVSRNEHKLGQLCAALKGTVTCAPGATAGKVKLTCA